MIVGVQGTKSFSDYNIFLRAMGTALRSIEDGDTEFFVYSAGPAQINSMAMEFSNISERTLKAQGIKIRMVKVSPKWLKENIHILGYMVYLSKPKEPITDVVAAAEAKDIEVGIYRY
jgi:hypothetical protein